MTIGSLFESSLVTQALETVPVHGTRDFALFHGYVDFGHRVR